MEGSSHTLNLFSIKITQKQRTRDNDWEGIIIIERPFLSKTCSHHLLIISLSFVSVCLRAHFVLITGNEKRRMELIFSFLFLPLNAVVGFLLFLHLSISSLKTHTHHNLLSRFVFLKMITPLPSSWSWVWCWVIFMIIVIIMIIHFFSCLPSKVMTKEDDQ